MVLLVYSHLQIVLFFRLLPSATFSSTPSFSLFDSTAATLSSTVFPRIVSAESILFRSCQLRLLNEGGY